MQALLYIGKTDRSVNHRNSAHMIAFERSPKERADILLIVMQSRLVGAMLGRKFQPRHHRPFLVNQSMSRIVSYRLQTDLITNRGCFIQLNSLRSLVRRNWVLPYVRKIHARLVRASEEVLVNGYLGAVMEPCEQGHQPKINTTLLVSAISSLSQFNRKSSAISLYYSLPISLSALYDNDERNNHR